jgi:HAD superfamily hydrolase (TIGR01509 family)
VDFLRVRPLIGMGADKVLPELAGLSPDSAEGARIVARRGEIFRREYLPTLKPTRGAQNLLEWLRHERVTIVAATSAEPEELHGLLRVAGATRLLDDASSSGDAERSKPDPDIVEAALKKAGCAPEEAIFIGDTPYDIDAGRRAGLPVIALRCGGWWADESFEMAVDVYDDPQHLLDNYLLSPFKRPLAVPSR